jgi:hypothetical protein
MAGALVWHLLHPLPDEDAGSTPATALKAAE